MGAAMFGDEFEGAPLLCGCGFVVGVDENVSVEEATSGHWRCLRNGGRLLAIMNLVAVEAPAAGVALTGKTPELCDAAFGIVPTGDGLQVVADQLIKAFAQGFGFLAGAGDELFVKGQGDIHEHSICGHGLCVKDLQNRIPQRGGSGASQRRRDLDSDLYSPFAEWCRPKWV